MQRTLKFRRRLAWSATIVTLVALLAWIGSGWFTCGYVFKSGAAAGVEDGWVGIVSRHDGTRPPGPVFETRKRWDDWLLVLWIFGRASGFAFPLWIPAGFGTCGTVLFWYRYRRALIASRSGLCPTCGYTRTGLDSAAPCPECGKAAAVAK